MKFDKKLTNICKGFALILMIVHHIFPGMEGFGLRVNGVWILPLVAVLGKVCVSIFLFLSGYGLYESCKNTTSLKDFYIKRLKAIYINYWMVFIIFTGIGYCFFRNIFLSFIQQPYSPIINLVINFSGLQYFFNGYMGYNPSWWFVSEIIALYLFFPLMKKMMNNKIGGGILAIICLGFFLPIHEIKIGGFYLNTLYFCPFIIGIFFSKYNLMNQCYNWIIRKKYNIICVIVFACLLSIFRIDVGLNEWGIRLDCILAPLYCVILYVCYTCRTGDRCYNALAFVGIHSFNIYLIHLFITNMYTTPYIYNLNSPIFMVGVTIIVSLIFSIAIEFVKRKLKLS